MLDSLDTLIAFTLIFLVVSLLITIVVQIITSLFNLRGKNLAWGISEAFEAIAPGLAADAKKLADHCLRDTLLSDFQMEGLKTRPASAVRTDELFELLHRIATDKKPSTPADIKAHVITLFTSLGVPAGMADAERAKLEDLETQLTASLAALPAGEPRAVLQNTLKETTDKLAAAAANTVAFAERWVAKGEDGIKHLYQQFEHLFETGKERAQEWFTIHARIVTGILGFAFAFLLQLDTFQIYKDVSSNRDLRAKILAQTDTITKQADKIIGGGASAPQKPEEKSAEADELKKIAGELKTVKTDLNKTGFALFPNKLFGRWGCSDWSARWFQHVLGMLASALLLSLGAPFWFNTLKSLASMRSSVAGNISDEKKADQKSGEANKPANPPPGVTQKPAQ